MNRVRGLRKLLKVLLENENTTRVVALMSAGKVSREAD